MSVRVDNLTKTYGNQHAVESISFEVQKGEIVGFLGPNGAGKSTTMKVATGYTPATSGVVEICGFDVSEKPGEIKKRIGYLPEHNPLYLDMFVREYLMFSAKLHGLSGSTLKRRVDEIVEMCGLTREQNKKIEALSKGYRQRVGLAQALIHDPEVLILDEPTTGLDPNQIVEIRKLIKKVSKDKTVIFSTHIMQEVQALCDRVIVINKGKLVADNSVEGLIQNEVKVAVLKVEFSELADIDSLKSIDGVTDVLFEGENKFTIKSEADVDVRKEVSIYATEHDMVLLSLQREEVTMENVFQELTRPD